MSKVTEKMLWKYFDLKYLSFTELKEAISEISQALIDLGITKDDMFTRMLRPGTSLPHGLQTQFCRHIHERRAPSNSFKILYVISKVEQTKLFLTAYIHFAPFKSSTFALTSSHPLTLSMSLAIIISPTKIISSFTYP